MVRESILKKINGDDPLAVPLCKIGYVPIDGWTFIHVLIYFIFALYGMGFLELFLTSVVWEYFEYLIDRPREPHVVSDFAANFIGFAAGYWARRYFAVGGLPGEGIIRVVKTIGIPD